MLLSSSVLLTILQLFVTHAAFGFPYPEGRTGLYLWLLFPMAASSAVAVLWNRRRAGILGGAGVVLLAVSTFAGLRPPRGMFET